MNYADVIRQTIEPETEYEALAVICVRLQSTLKGMEFILADLSDEEGHADLTKDDLEDILALTTWRADEAQRALREAEGLVRWVIQKRREGC